VGGAWLETQRVAPSPKDSSPKDSSPKNSSPKGAWVVPSTFGSRVLGEMRVGLAAGLWPTERATAIWRSYNLEAPAI